MVSIIRYLAVVLLLTMSISAIVSSSSYIPSSVINEMSEISKTSETKDWLSFWGPYDSTLPWYDKAQDKAGFNVPWYNPAWDSAGWPLAENSAKMGLFVTELYEKGAITILKTFVEEEFEVPSITDVFNPEKMDKYQKLWQDLSNPPPKKDFRPYYTASLASAYQKLSQQGIGAPQLSPSSSNMLSNEYNGDSGVNEGTDVSGTSGVSKTEKTKADVYVVWVDNYALSDFWWYTYHDPDHPGVPPCPVYLLPGVPNTYGYDWVNLPESQRQSYGTGYFNAVKAYLASFETAGVGPLVDGGQNGDW